MSSDPIVTVTEDALKALAQNRPGRRWLRENAELWEEQGKMYRVQAEKLDHMARTARKLCEDERDDRADPNAKSEPDPNVDVEANPEAPEMAENPLR